MSGPALLVGHSLKRVRTLVLTMGILLAGFQLILIVVAKSIQRSGGFAQLSAMLPSFARDLMGPTLTSFMSFTGFVCLGYFHLAVMGSLVAVTIALSTMPASEVESGFIDLILARPLARHWIITRTIIVIILAIIVLLGWMMLGTWLGCKRSLPGAVLRPVLATQYLTLENGSMPHRLTLCQMAEQIRARKISPVDLVEAHLQQIEAHNPKLNAFVRVLHEEARAGARSADNAVANGNALGPLHGVPITIKDSFDMAGVPTTCGSRFFQDLPARQDATAVARFKKAGAIPLGRTNTPEFLSNYETDNYVTGRTNNPWNLNCTPGGSSGGESAAISSYCSAGGIGSDGGGSVRIPAHFCGIAGLKPTPGRVSAVGHMPEICHPGGLLGVAGPMARTAADVKLLFEVLAGYDDQDPFSSPVPLRAPDLSAVHVGFMEQWYAVPVQAAVRRAVTKAAVCLEQLGFPVQPFQPIGLERAPNVWWFFFGELPARITKELIAGREDQAHWTGTEFLHRALGEPEPTAKQVLANLAIRDKMRAGLLRQMEKCPVLLMPVCGVAAFEHRQRRYLADGREIGLFEAMMPVTPFNLLGMPGMVIPFDFDERGMPVGVQLVGRPYEEELLLELAVRLEEARGPFPGPAGY